MACPPLRYGAILTIIISISMAVLDGAIANVALPTIATGTCLPCQLYLDCEMHTKSPLSSACPVFLGDMFGYRRIYKCGLSGISAFIIVFARFQTRCRC